MNVSVHKSMNNNFTEVVIGDSQLYFSYETLIAFRKAGELYISENVWGTTTGKHLNAVYADKSVRMPYADFQKATEKVLKF